MNETESQILKLFAYHLGFSTLVAIGLPGAALLLLGATEHVAVWAGVTLIAALLTVVGRQAAGVKVPATVGISAAVAVGAYILCCTIGLAMLVWVLGQTF